MVRPEKRVLFMFIFFIAITITVGFFSSTSFLDLLDRVYGFILLCLFFIIGSAFFHT